MILVPDGVLRKNLFDHSRLLYCLPSSFIMKFSEGFHRLRSGGMRATFP